MIDVRGAATAAAELDAPATLNVPLFRSIIERMDPERRWIVLDLGAAHTDTLALFGRFRCRIDVADVADGGIDALNAETEPDRLEALAESLLPPPHAEAADVILCWDLLNYLEKPAMSALMSRVAARAHPDAAAHALIAYSARTMPARPAGYAPIDDRHVVHRARAGRERAAPRYTPEDLKLCLHEYSIERAMLLANGMQEFLLKTRAR